MKYEGGRRGDTTERKGKESYEDQIGKVGKRRGQEQVINGGETVTERDTDHRSAASTLSLA